MRTESELEPIYCHCDSWILISWDQHHVVNHNHLARSVRFVIDACSCMRLHFRFESIDTLELIKKNIHQTYWQLLHFMHRRKWMERIIGSSKPAIQIQIKMQTKSTITHESQANQWLVETNLQTIMYFSQPIRRIQTQYPTEKKKKRKKPIQSVLSCAKNL